MANEISLSCLILGSKDPISIDIPPSKTVAHLKDAIKIKEEPDLNHVAARSLEILKVNDPRTVYPHITDV